MLNATKEFGHELNILNLNIKPISLEWFTSSYSVACLLIKNTDSLVPNAVLIA